ncbi:histone-lysine N-methyltransferase SETMAR [Trichonephila clavipes]|nr:histone-lysine N-methyltransferase SETMAR [Trichonephila clavipes]
MVQHVKRKRPLLRNGLLLHHDNARTHIARCVMYVSKQNNVEILPHPPYCPDLTRCDFCLFPRLKKPLRENSLAVLNHKILEANSQVQNVKLGGHQTCLSINRLWHELCDMLRRLVGTTAPGHHDCSIQE